MSDRAPAGGRDQKRRLWSLLICKGAWGGWRRGRKKKRGDLGRRDGRDEVKMNERGGLARRGDKLTRTGAEKQDKTRGHEPAEGGDGADCAGQRGPSLVRGRRWRFEGLTRTRNCTKALNMQRAGLARGGTRGGRQGAPALEGCKSLVMAPALARAIQSFIRNGQEQATIRRAGEIARLSMAQLGLVGVPGLPNQGAQVHPKKARPATVLFRRPFRLSGSLVVWLRWQRRVQ